MMLELPDKAIEIGQLNEELDLLGLPSFVGTARLSRRPDADGVWAPSPPYILIKCDTLSPAQEAAVKGVVDSHVPAPRPPDLQQEAKDRIIATIRASRRESIRSDTEKYQDDLAVAQGWIEPEAPGGMM